MDQIFPPAFVLKSACKNIDHMFYKTYRLSIFTVSNSIRFCEFNEHIYYKYINLDYDIRDISNIQYAVYQKMARC